MRTEKLLGFKLLLLLGASTPEYHSPPSRDLSHDDAKFANPFANDEATYESPNYSAPSISDMCGRGAFEIGRIVASIGVDMTSRSGDVKHSERRAH